MPSQIIKQSGSEGIISENYDATEFPLEINEILVAEKELNGWIYGAKVENPKLKAWAPLNCLSEVLETERMYIRRMETDDFEDLSEIYCDEQSMRYYPRPFTKEELQIWISKNRSGFSASGYGLCSLLLKKDFSLIGDCGITKQQIDGEELPELGYHIKKDYYNKGFATEASSAFIKYAFDKLKPASLYTYTSYENVPSIKVAEKNGMKFVKEFTKDYMGESVREILYSRTNEDMIKK